ncbi:hypothetical protein THSYN_26725 [Candidatus Thiodictyon syntrophicum]|uniref:Uncharacterized protein n=1 Tax=Candidatus Thiodictyon syntrophicum TaxID=1166950 RepID=A0A2K8UGC9_9GAMM|nr:hypothetical protein THSYN_26725 [Candidatus Thiodictyon syntrophicum]
MFGWTRLGHLGWSGAGSRANAGHLRRHVQAVAKARGVPLCLLVEEALRCIVAPEPFATPAEADAEIEALQADVLKRDLSPVNLLAFCSRLAST